MFPFDSVFYHLVLFAFNCLIFKELCRPLSSVLSRDSFYILPRRWLPVNTFFQFIFKFVFLWWPSCRRLCYLITFTPFLSTPFFLFLRLFSSFLSCRWLPSLLFILVPAIFHSLSIQKDSALLQAESFCHFYISFRTILGICPTPDKSTYIQRR